MGSLDFINELNMYINVYRTKHILANLKPSFKNIKTFASSKMIEWPQQK